MEHLEELEETVLEITGWYKRLSAPNESRKYSRCPVCDHTWWDDKEVHNLDCWVWRLAK